MALRRRKTGRRVRGVPAAGFLRKGLHGFPAGFVAAAVPELGKSGPQGLVPGSLPRRHGAPPPRGRKVRSRCCGAQQSKTANQCQGVPHPCSAGYTDGGKYQGRIACGTVRKGKKAIAFSPEFLLFCLDLSPGVPYCASGHALCC